MVDYSSASAFFSAIRRRIALALATVTSFARAELDLNAVRGSTCENRVSGKYENSNGWSDVVVESSSDEGEGGCDRE